jgi:hypothetical protein
MKEVMTIEYSNVLNGFDAGAALTTRGKVEFEEIREILKKPVLGPVSE